MSQEMPTSTIPAAIANQINTNQQEQDEVATTAPPTPPPNNGDELSAAAPPTLKNADQVSAPLPTPLRANQHEQEERLRFEKRGWLMIVATLVASLTYQAALNPPGGYWQEDTVEVNPNTKPHVAGTPVLSYTHWYQWFMLLNSSVFLASVIVILLLMRCTKVCTGKINMWILETVMAVGLLCLMAAYATITGATCFNLISVFVCTGIIALFHLIFAFISNLVRRCTRPSERELRRAAERTAEEA